MNIHHMVTTTGTVMDYLMTTIIVTTTITVLTGIINKLLRGGVPQRCGSEDHKKMFRLRAHQQKRVTAYAATPRDIW